MSFHQLLEQGQLEEARRVLARVEGLGVKQAELSSMRSALEEGEGHARTVEIEAVVSHCKGYDENRIELDYMREVLGCWNNVLLLDHRHEDALYQKDQYEYSIAWEEAEDEDTVEAYYGFVQKYKDVKGFSGEYCT